MATICRRAGVTRGALQHHFGGQKTDLIAAVAVQLYDKVLGAYRVLVDQVEASGAEDGLRAAFAELALSSTSPEVMALIEIWMAARGDKELARAVLPTIRKIDERANELWLELCGRSSAGEAYRVIGRALRSGLAIETLIHGRSESLREVALFLGELLAVDRINRQPMTNDSGPLIFGERVRSRPNLIDASGPGCEGSVRARKGAG